MADEKEDPSRDMTTEPHTQPSNNDEVAPHAPDSGQDQNQNQDEDKDLKKPSIDILKASEPGQMELQAEQQQNPSSESDVNTYTDIKDTVSDENQDPKETPSDQVSSTAISPQKEGLSDNEDSIEEAPKELQTDTLNEINALPEVPESERTEDLAEAPSQMAPLQHQSDTKQEIISEPVEESTQTHSPQQSDTSPTMHETEKHDEHEELIHVDFDLLDAEGRWLLKVLSGPNSGAEFSLQSGTTYLIGSDPSSCDIFFQDLSVSRQHARLIIDTKDRAIVEDLGSRNGTLIDSEKLIGKKQVVGTSLLTLGTTSFILVDKEGERKTLVAPTFSMSQQSPQQAQSVSSQPNTQSETEKRTETDITSQMGDKERGQEPWAQKELPKSPQEQRDEALGPIQQAVLAPLQSEVEKIKEEEKRQAKAAHAISSLAILAVVSGIILVIGVGTTLLFQTEEIERPHALNAETVISQALQEFPTVRYSFNPTNNRLLLVGHVLTTVDRSKILDNLQQLKFISSIDSSNIVIDELVWRESNQILAKNPAWKGITISSPAAGRYIVSGFLRTRQQADELYDYLSQNFPYVDLLEKRVVVEEDLISQVTKLLTDAGFRTVLPSFSSGILTLKGAISGERQPQFDELLNKIKAVPGVRGVQVTVTSSAKEEAVINITTKYPVTGYSQRKGALTVVIGGKILSKGDILDGMQITDITSNAVYLEKDDVKYKIDFNR